MIYQSENGDGEIHSNISDALYMTVILIGGNYERLYRDVV